LAASAFIRGNAWCKLGWHSEFVQRVRWHALEGAADVGVLVQNLLNATPGRLKH
jgi:hypothetical protein